MMLRVVLAVLLPVAAYQSPLPTDCSDIYRAGSGLDGVYTIYPAGPTSPVQVYCDMSKDSIDNSAEKWTVIQKRQDGTVNFFMKWDHYKTGFGSAAGEYWLGLENMHLLTQGKNYELRVDMEDFEGQKVYAQYSSFSVGPESEGYRLNLGSFMKGSSRLCYGGFWYAACFGANPNGVYTWGPSPRAAGVQWNGFKGLEYSLKTMIMKIRPVAE